MLTLLLPAINVIADAVADAATAEVARKAEVNARTEKFHEIKKRFYFALLDGNLEEAKHSVYMRPDQMPLLVALIKRYSAEQQYCDSFELSTGFQPEIDVSTRRNLRDGWKWEVEVEGDVATEWKIPYRKVNGEWLVDLDERDYVHAMTESIPILDAEAADFDRATDDMKKQGRRTTSEAAKLLRDLRKQTKKATQPIYEAAQRECFRRMLAGAQGTWAITLFQHESPLVKTPPQPVTGTLTIEGSTLRTRTPNPRWNGEFKFIFHEDALQAFTLKNVNKEGSGEIDIQWDIERYYARRKIEGVLTDSAKPNGAGEFWTIRSDQRIDAPTRLDVKPK